MLTLADVNHFLLGLEPWWAQELLNIERRSANRRSVARFLNDESKLTQQTNVLWAMPLDRVYWLVGMGYREVLG